VVLEKAATEGIEQHDADAVVLTAAQQPLDGHRDVGERAHRGHATG
jgi:hypothetical protein